MQSRYVRTSELWNEIENQEQSIEINSNGIFIERY